MEEVDMRTTIVCLALALLGTVTTAFAAPPIAVEIDGIKQGRFKADSPRGTQALRLIYEAKSPRDPATGQASGKRQHGPVCFTKELGASSPQLFQSLVTNEVLKSVLFRYLKTNPNGEEYVYYTLKLTNATIANYKQISGYTDSATTATAKHAALYDTSTQEEVCLVFQRIEMQSLDGKTMAMDDWFAVR
jgi:type VI secretion system secreted protein Hcp